MVDTYARQRTIIGTTANWAANDLVVGDGEIAAERLVSGVVKLKVGDGARKFSELPYAEGQFNLTELDARYVNEIDTTVIGGAGQSNKVPRLDSTGVLDDTVIPFVDLDGRYVNEIDTTVVSSPSKVVRLTAAGILDASVIPVTALDGRYVNESDTTQTGGIGYENKWPKLDNAGKIDNALLHTEQLNGLFVPIAQTHQIGGVGAANAWPRMSSDGKLDGSLLRTSLLSYKGQIHAELVPAPASPLNGDFYMQAIDATVGSGWGAISGEVIGHGDFLSYSITGGWQIYDSQIDPLAYVKRDGDIMSGALSIGGAAEPDRLFTVRQLKAGGVKASVINDGTAASAFASITLSSLNGAALSSFAFGPSYVSNGAFKTAGALIHAAGAGGLGLVSETGHTMFYTGPGHVERVRITYDGWVGIGTGVPQAKFHVHHIGTPIDVSSLISNDAGNLKFNVTAIGNAQIWAFVGKPLMIGHDNYAGTQTVRMTIDANGWVGIGTTNPGAPLEVVGAAEALRLTTTSPRGQGRDYMTFNDPTGRKGYFGYGSTVDDFSLMNEMASNMYFGNNGVFYMTLTSGGTLGLGVTAPAATFHVKSPEGGALIEGTGNAGGFVGVKNTVSFWTMGMLGALGWDRWSLYNQMTGGEAISVLQNNNVGIGITAPNTKLHIADNAWPRFKMTLNGVGSWALGGFGANHQFGIFLNEGAASFKIDTAGNVGIGGGAPPPRARLHVDGPTGAIGGALPAGQLLITDDAGTAACLSMGIHNSGSGGYIQARNTSSAAFYNLMLNPSGGYVGINTTTPAMALDVRYGDHSIGFLPAWSSDVNLLNSTKPSTGAMQDIVYNARDHRWWNGFTQVGILTSGGDFSVTGNISAYSDRKLKTNLTPITDALDKVCTLTGYTYDRIDHPDSGRQAGLIAQEVQEVLPEVVGKDKDGTLTLAYGNTLALLVEAIKELRAEVAELKEQLK